MSEMMGVTVRLKVRPEWLTMKKVLCDWKDEGYYEDHDLAEGAPPVLEELLYAIGSILDFDANDNTLTLSGEMNYGWGTNAPDTTLVELGIAFVASTDAKYEYDGDIAWWAPGMADIDGRPAGNAGVTLSGHEYRQMREKHLSATDHRWSNGDDLRAFASALDNYFVDPWALISAAPLPSPYVDPEA
jgi:hypothetical protein